jgi:hypothetical protein
VQHEKQSPKADWDFTSLLSPLLWAAVIVYLGLIVGTIFLIASLRQARGSLFEPSLTESLLANALSIIVSAMIIAPVSALFLKQVQERRLRPVRAEFISTMRMTIDEISNTQRRFQIDFDPPALTLSMTVSTKTIFDGFASLNRSLFRRRPEITGPEPPEEPTDMEVEARKLREENIVMLTDLIDRHCEDMFQVTSSLETTLVFCTPLFDANAILHLSTIRTRTLEYRNRLRDLRALLRSPLDKALVLRGGEAVLNVRSLINELIEICQIDPHLTTPPPDESVLSLVTYEKQKEVLATVIKALHDEARWRDQLQTKAKP